MVTTPQDIFNQIEKIKEETNQEIASRVTDIAWNVIEDMRSSYVLVLESLDLEQDVVDTILNTVNDYTGKEYGD